MGSPYEMGPEQQALMQMFAMLRPENQQLHAKQTHSDTLGRTNGRGSLFRTGADVPHTSQSAKSVKRRADGDRTTVRAATTVRAHSDATG